MGELDRGDPAQRTLATMIQDRRLLHLIACPDCGNLLFLQDDGLVCRSCSRHFLIRNGIPLLYPRTVNLDRLREEENLAAMMRLSPIGESAAFTATQWEKSKVEFWAMVKAEMGKHVRNMVYLGSGYDARAREFQSDDLLFVNFDLVHEMLATLQDRYGAKASVAGDIQHLPFRKEACDVVVCIDVLHHQSDSLPRLIRSLADILRPGGQLFLEDVNAWGLFQFPKSILLPKPIYRFLRAQYHSIRESKQRPADYEFPTSPWFVERLLKRAGFEGIRFHPNSSYPCVPRILFQAYQALGTLERVRKFHNFHYMISARKKSEPHSGQ
jgi:SAM-dependent methyltransferase